MSGNVDWVGADWAEQDVVLASRYGVSRERVRQARIRHGGGARSPRHRKSTGDTAASRLEGMDTEGMTLEEVAIAAGCKGQYASVTLRALGKGFAKGRNGNARYDWGKFPVGWEGMTDKEIGEVVGVGDPAVVAQWRNRHWYVKGVVRVPQESR